MGHIPVWVTWIVQIKFYWNSHTRLFLLMICGRFLNPVTTDVPAVIEGPGGPQSVKYLLSVLRRSACWPLSQARSVNLASGGPGPCPGSSPLASILHSCAFSHPVCSEPHCPSLLSGHASSISTPLTSSFSGNLWGRFQAFGSVRSPRCLNSAWHV